MMSACARACDWSLVLVCDWSLLIPVCGWPLVELRSPALDFSVNVLRLQK